MIISPGDSSSLYAASKSIAISIITVSFAAILITFHADPAILYNQIHEDGLVEYLSAFFLMLASVTMLTLAYYYMRSKATLFKPLAALFIASVFFIMCMEEISWGQRIIGVDSPEFFVSNNMQNETNLHNLHTNFFQALLYLGAFTLLTLLPVFRSKASHLLKKLRLSSLSVFLPSAWLFVPFAMISGLTYINDLPQNIVATVLSAITVGLLGLLVVRMAKESTPSRLHLPVLASLLISTATFISINTFDFDTSVATSGMFSEYKEFFIALGTFCYAASVYANQLAQPREGTNQPPLKRP